MSTNTQLKIHKLTNSMVQCHFLETNSRFVNQEILYPLWNQQVYDHKI
jgi:hypothetical protein